MVMAHLSTQTTRDDPEERLRWKLRLVRYLYERGYGRQDILELFRFIDWLLTLPAAWEQRFQQALEDYEASMSTPYITSPDRCGSFLTSILLKPKFQLHSPRNWDRSRSRGPGRKAFDSAVHLIGGCEVSDNPTSKCR